MGFHWEWCAVKATGPDVLSKIQRIRGPPMMMATGLTFDEVHKQLENYADRRSDWWAGCTFGDWTFLTGSVTFWDDNLVRIAKELNTDTCVAAAESTTWVLFMQYAKPGGIIRRRSFTLEDTEDVGKSRVEVVVRTTANGPLRRDDEGKEESEGTPLPGEPLGVVIADDERLLNVLAAIGVPLQACLRHYVGDWDWKAMKEIPATGSKEKAFTLFIEGPLKSTKPAPPVKKGFLGRLFRK